MPALRVGGGRSAAPLARQHGACLLYLAIMANYILPPARCTRREHMQRPQPSPTHFQPRAYNQEEARSYQDSPSTLAGLARSSSGLRSDMGSGMMGSSEQRAHSPLKVWWWSWY